MTSNDQLISNEYIKLAFAIEEYIPGYVDAYYGPAELKNEAQQDGKLPLQNLTERAARLSNDISQADMDTQRKDFLARQVTAMQMSLRLLSGETVSLADEVEALYDVRPTWKDETLFEEAHKELSELLPPGDSLTERMQAWNRSLEIPIEKVKELLPLVITRLKELTNIKFNLPKEESFTLEFVSNQPWGAYNWYLGSYRSRIDFNTDLPTRINRLPDLLAHEGYPGHHTELSIKEKKLTIEKKHIENTLNLINSPSCVVAEGIATSALETIMTDDDLEALFRDELLPRADMNHIDSKRLVAIIKAGNKLAGIGGNAAFMLHDQKKSDDEVTEYIKRYRLATEKEARQSVKFISNPVYRSYIFTYFIGHELLAELFTNGEHDKYFARLLEEPVTPSQIRQWIVDTQQKS